MKRLPTDPNCKTTEYIGMAFETTALVIGALYRGSSGANSSNKDGLWNFVIIEENGTGNNFDESRALVEKQLSLIYDAVLLMERPNHVGTHYELSKDDVYTFDPSVKSCMVGLGWDPALHGDASIDVDGSVILFDEQKRHVYNVFYGQQKYKDMVLHSGDNLTGEGEGDDEQIHVHFDRIAKANSSSSSSSSTSNGDDTNKVAYVVICVNIYNGASTFRAIRKCFVRLVHENGSELCRFRLSTTDGDSSKNFSKRGVIMGMLYRCVNPHFAAKLQESGSSASLEPKWKFKALCVQNDLRSVGKAMPTSARACLDRAHDIDDTKSNDDGDRDGDGQGTHVVVTSATPVDTGNAENVALVSTGGNTDANSNDNGNTAAGVGTAGKKQSKDSICVCCVVL